MLRILPGVDVLETRYSAAKRIFEEAGLNDRRRRVHRRRQRQDQVDRRGLHPARRASTRSGWTPAPQRSRRSRRSRMPARRCPSSPARTSRTSCRSGRTEASPRSRRPIRPTSGARRSSPRSRSCKGEAVPGPEWVLPQPAITAENLDQYRQRNDAAAALRHVRLRGDAQLSGGLGRAIAPASKR